MILSVQSHSIMLILCFRSIFIRCTILSDFIHTVIREADDILQMSDLSVTDKRNNVLLQA